MVVVEINSGYLRAIETARANADVLRHPKVDIAIDDIRRWLARHPDRRLDAIVQNTTFHWRAHASSMEYLERIRQHLEPGGAFFFNTTGSDRAIATALAVVPHVLRFANCLAVSDNRSTSILSAGARSCGTTGWEMLRCWILGAPKFESGSTRSLTCSTPCVRRARAGTPPRVASSSLLAPLACR